MLVIRDEMIDALAAGTYAGFVGRARTHLQRFFPEACTALGNVRLGQVIEYGIQRARSWGFVLEPDIVCYLGLMMTFGYGFDRPDQHPWARQILLSQAPADPSQRMARLNQAAQAALLQRSGQGRPGDPRLAPTR